jgi:hypothetical protein
MWVTAVIYLFESKQPTGSIMRRLYEISHSFFIVFLLYALLTGCTSTDIRVVSAPPEKPIKLGPAQGTASGVLLLGIIPIGINSRTERAYKDALKNVPGSTTLTDVTLDELWLYFGIMLFQQVTITGEAVK